MQKKVSKEVYVPSDDSFLLEKEILKKDLRKKTCLDLGTGSGIQAIAMLKAGAKIVVCADINKEALKNAKENIVKYLLQKGTQNIGQIFFIRTDLFKNLKDWKFDFIAFNAPYVPSEKIKWVDLDGGKKGREITDKFITQFPGQLLFRGEVLLLISSLNAPQEIISILKKKDFLAKVVAKKKLFFEELMVLKIKKDLN